MTELCLSTRANQLLRWQQAFPQGRISTTTRELTPFFQPEVQALATPQTLQQVALVVRNGGLWIGPNLINRLAGKKTCPATCST